MNKTNALLKLEWRRIWPAFALACGIQTLLLIIVSIPDSPFYQFNDMFAIGIASPALLLSTALFSSLTSDREQWPFLFSLSYSGKQLFCLRVAIRLGVQLAAGLLFFMLMALFSGANITGLWRALLMLFLAVHLLPSSFFIFFSPLLRGLPLLMTVIFGLLISIPAQFPATSVSLITDWSDLIILLLLQPALLAMAGGYFLWKCRLTNRSPNRTITVWCALILLLPLLEWGCVTLSTLPRLAIAKEKAREAGIELITPQNTLRPFKTFDDADTDAFLKEFGYSPTREPFYCSATALFSRHRWDMIRLVRQNITRQLLEAFAANDAESMKRCIDIELFCRFATSNDILYTPSVIGPESEQALQTLIEYLESATRYDFSSRYALDLEDAEQRHWRANNNQPPCFLTLPFINSRKIDILKRETEAFRNVAQLRAKTRNELNSPPNRSILVNLIRQEHQQRDTLALQTEALKLKLQYHRTGLLPETLDADIPFRYERTATGFRFLNRKGQVIIQYSLPERTHVTEEN